MCRVCTLRGARGAPLAGCSSLHGCFPRCIDLGIKVERARAVDATIVRRVSMRIGSEFLSIEPPAPLPATVVARPVRACVLVPSVTDVSWYRIVEHALAAQSRVWGGGSNLIVPTGWDVAEDELFWRLVDRFDPDVLVVHAPSWEEVEAIAPEIFESRMTRVRAELSDLGFSEEAQSEEVARLRGEIAWGIEPTAELQTKLIERVALLHHDADARIEWITGGASPPYPLTDVASFRELPPAVADVSTTAGDLDQLLLTHNTGRLLAPFKSELERRGVALNPVLVERRTDVLNLVWPRGRVDLEYSYPSHLASSGLSRRIWFWERDRVVVVAGDAPRDFLLFHGLSRLRSHVFWLPATLLDDGDFVSWVVAAAAAAARNTGARDGIDVTTAESDAAAEATLAAVQRAPQRGQPGAQIADWQTLIPGSPLSSADPGSERRAALLRHEGVTQELPTAVPLSVSTTDATELRWMVDVHVQGWTPARHPRIGAEVLHGPMVTEHDVRASAAGPSYFGQSPFVQRSLGLEASAARPRLRPRTVLEQVTDILRPLGWDASLSDKGAFAERSARLFGGVDDLAGELRPGPTRRVLDAYLTPSTSNDPGLYLTDTRRRYLSLADVSEAIGEEADGGSVVADLYTRGALLRGHILKCEHCRGTSFYSLNERQEFTCVRCRTSQQATRFSWLGEPEPGFRYALNEVLFQFLTHNGDVPLLAACDHFVVGRAGEQRSFDIAFEVEVVSPSGDKSEHDIVATWGSELWLGEATTTDKLGSNIGQESERLRRLKDVADVLLTEGVLLATTSAAFRPRTRQAISRVFTDPVRPTVVVREGADQEEANGE